MRTVVLALVVGVGVTLRRLARARRGARRKIPPIAALREGAVLPRGRFARFTPVLAVLLALVGLLLILQGFSGSGSVSQRLLGMGIGALLVFIAVAMLARYVVRPVTRVLGWPLERVAGTTGRLARENAMRNPARTARTAAALMIGLGLVVFVSVFAQGLKDGFRSAVTGSLREQRRDAELDIPADARRCAPRWRRPIRTSPLVSSIVSDDARLNGSGTAHDRADRSRRRLRVSGSSSGSRARIRRDSSLDGRGVLVDGRPCEVAQAPPGKHVRARHADPARRRRTSCGHLRREQLAADGVPDGARRVPADLGEPGPGERLRADEAREQPGDRRGPRPEARLRRPIPIVEIKTNGQFVKAQLDSLNPIIYLLYALLAMSVIISLFGIVNSLVLSIFERTREIGMLRAIGLSRRQTRRMVRYESVITSVIGGILGTIVGLFFGWVMAKGLANQGIEFSVPVGQLIIFLVVSAIAGVLSAILPARRASRVKILEALSYE